ncbi:MAG TPA: hypothetical protein VH008_01530, partial [Pseudonocardia sp.]|nr:hypothetical protein [Pseudonocardia sp.]
AGEPRLPALRVGLAHGRVVALDGDLYGSVVNLAARLVHQAEPGRVVSDAALALAAAKEALAETVPEDTEENIEEAAEDTEDTDDVVLSFTALPPRQLPGFDAPVTPYLVADDA